MRELSFSYAVAFCTGFVVMSVEIASSRVLAPFFGTGVYVWGALISAILAAISVGYFLGGWVADNRDSGTSVARILLLSSICLLFTTVAGHSVTAFGYNLGFNPGLFFSVLVLFFPPMLLVSMVTPNLVKAETKRLKNLGMTAGSLYSVSSMGSIAGTLATAFFFLPYVGTRFTLVLDCAVLFSLSFSMMKKNGLHLLFVTVLILGSFDSAPALPLRDGERLIYYGESQHNLIYVFDSRDYTRLNLNTPSFGQTVMQKQGRPTVGYTRVFSIGPSLTGGKKALFLGLGGGTAIMEAVNRYGVDADVVELDPGVVRVSEKYFGLKKTSQLRVHVGDARRFLLDHSGYDYVVVDLFNTKDVPYHAATVEFFSLASQSLGEDGVILMNVVDKKEVGGLADAVATTMNKAFPSVYIIPVGSNKIILGLKRQSNLPALKEEIEETRDDFEADAYSLVLKNVRDYVNNGDLFTDDRSSIDKYAIY